MKDMEILCPPLMKWIKSSKSKQRRTSADVEKRIGNPNPPEYDTTFRCERKLTASYTSYESVLPSCKVLNSARFC